MEPRRSLRINRIAAPIFTLGPGRRLGLWVQGCSIGCDGCASIDTWDPQGGTTVAVDDLVAQVVRTMTDLALDGLTITGGEPFQQAAPLADMLSGLRGHKSLDDCDVLVFTGYAAARSRCLGPALWDAADALVCGPYVRSRPGDGWLRASGNQELVLRTTRAHEHYANPEPLGVQMAATEDGIALAGLPRAGDLNRFRALMHDRGIDFEEVSWES